MFPAPQEPCSILLPIPTVLKAGSPTTTPCKDREGLDQEPPKRGRNPSEAQTNGDKPCRRQPKHARLALKEEKGKEAA